MSYQYYPIQGIKDGIGPGGKVPIRREITEWTESTDPTDQIQVILYLLALKRFQAVAPEDRDSYFQIAGIHGFPNAPWDEPKTTQDEVRGKGYCVHANNLFPPWHRPYMLLYEQRIYEIMVGEIIPRYPSHKDEYLKAVSTWRHPYWDWAKNPTMPGLARMKRVGITVGGEPKIVIDNPLYQFRMPNDKPMSVHGVGKLADYEGGPPIDYGVCYATTRCPKKEERVNDSEAWKEGVVHNEDVDSFMSTHSSVTDANYGSAAELVYRLLTYPLDYPHFATLARDESKYSAGASKASVTNDINLEFIHNNIHYWVGGNGGHMSMIPVATFDPSFWLHHMNIDRLYAIWQTMNPDKWFESDIQRFFDQKIVGSGDVITNKSPLRPFHKDKTGTVWTPDDARDWFKLGYTYPDVPTGKETREQLLKMVNETYGISRKEALLLGQKANEMPLGMEITDRGKDGINGVKVYDYALSIKYHKFALGGFPFNIEVYLRPEKETENKFRTTEFVTSVFNFSQPAENEGKEVCSNCKKGEAQNVQVTAYVPVTSYLIKMFKEGQLDSLDKTTVASVLERMYWRIVDISGKPIPEAQWKDTMGLEITVSQTQMSYSPDPSTQPSYPPPEVIPNLGTGASQSGPPTPPGAVGNIITVAKINKLEAEVASGGSIVFKSPSMDLSQPRREPGTGIQLLYWPGQGDPKDSESYDILLSMVIKPTSRVIQCNFKLAGKGYDVITNITPSPWFGGSPELKVDIKENEFFISVDGRKAGSYKRMIKKNVTHVHYYTSPSRAQPVMAREIMATTTR